MNDELIFIHHPNGITTAHPKRHRLDDRQGLNKNALYYIIIEDIDLGDDIKSDNLSTEKSTAWKDRLSLEELKNKTSHFEFRNEYLNETFIQNQLTKHDN
jgi:hypothetical protein